MMYNPISTYRIQFHKDFNFKDFSRIVPYLKALGIKTIYASPIFEAVPGSMHGYDMLSPLRINPEIGSEAELFKLSRQLKSAGIGWIQDIVPNHMAFHPGNPWLADVLEKGNDSEYVSFFDIRFPSASGDDERVMVPFLGTSLEEAIAAKKLKVIVRGGKGFLSYEGLDWPINDAAFKWYKSQKSKAAATTITQVAALQHYRLCAWMETDQQINYRRFFTVNGLICLNIQQPNVFDAYHQYIKVLLEKEVFQGLRVDHVDGLYDPQEYLKRLRLLAGETAYIVIEKILEQNEEVPSEWDIQGTTGYDFLALVNNLFTNSASEKKLTRIYEKQTGAQLEIPEQISDKKTEILYASMAGELENLYLMFLDLELGKKKQLKKLKAGALKKVIGEFLIRFPVYRSYDNTWPLDQEQQEVVCKLLDDISVKKKLKPAAELLRAVLLSPSEGIEAAMQQKILNFYQRCMQFSGPLMAKGVEDTLMYTYNRFAGHNEVGDSPDTFGLSIKAFHRKMKYRTEHWPQALNGTATHDTKRGEDVRSRLNVLTDLPVKWVKLVEALNQVTPLAGPDANDRYLIYQTILGTMPMPGEEDPDFESRITAYLEKAIREAKQHSTWTDPDDHYEDKAKDLASLLLEKKGQGLALLEGFLAEIADYGIINSLSQLILKLTCPGVPDIYQGTELWDLSLVDPDNRRPVDYAGRLQLLNNGTEELNQHVSVKASKAAVGFSVSDGELNGSDSEPSSSDHVLNISELWQDRYSGKIKLILSRKLLELRKQFPALFQKGTYIPLSVKGKYKKQILAFARQYDHTCIVTIVPVGLAALCEKEQQQLFDLDWGNTRVDLPSNVPGEFYNELNGAKGTGHEGHLLLTEVFEGLPIAVLKFKSLSDRGAGILLHISSLPSPFGIGDLGKPAWKFIDFLAAGGQKYWQVLPVNPVHQDQCYSPYSSSSSIAGNILFINLEQLENDLLSGKDEELNRHKVSGSLSEERFDQHDQQLLSRQEISSAKLKKGKSAVRFNAVFRQKTKLLEKAYQKFISFPEGSLQVAFRRFCAHEKDWLNDFALFMFIKARQEGEVWWKWPAGLKFRDPVVLAKIAAEYPIALNEIKWQQFIFFRQWKTLRDYASSKKIRLIGDLPFYMDHDSADVWSAPDIFKLDADLEPIAVAGVPPDYFNADGQLWGMPVFNWDVLKSQNYQWWIRRVRKNLERYDLLRLDHFRAFSSYWEVPVNAASAKEGKWMAGPGTDFFRVLKLHFSELPFIAEDLGEMDEAVYKLRDDFNLPGMKVLQFAFGTDMMNSVHIPFNYDHTNCLVYTGTHDNNTSLGWLNKDASSLERKHLKAYLGHPVKKEKLGNELIRMAYSSVAKIAIIPMQDIIGLDESGRMNVPSSTTDNWFWRLRGKKMDNKTARALLRLVKIYGRG